jgi:hypothetical protein
MKGLSHILFNSISNDVNNERVLNTIKQNLAEYYFRNITFSECLSKTSPMTADLIIKYGAEENQPKSGYDTILFIVTNYYTMLHIDMYTGFYAINKNYTYNHVTILVEEALKEIDNNGGFKTHRYKYILQKSRDFTKEMVEVYYRVGTYGCHDFVVSSIYSILLSVNMKKTVGRDQIENIIHTIQAEKLFIEKYHYG